MAKKTTKKVSKTTKKAASKKKTASKKKSTKKAAAVKSTSKKKTTKKAAPAKKVTKTTKKKAAPKVAKKVAKKVTKKVAKKTKATTKKVAKKTKVTSKKTVKKAGTGKKKTSKKVAAKQDVVVEQSTKKTLVIKQMPKLTLKKITSQNVRGTGTNGISVAPFGSKPAEFDAVGKQLSENQLKRVKTGLSRADLNYYKQLLMAKRSEILGDVEALQTDARKSGGNLSNMPLHMADVGSDNFEQEFTLGLVESERKLLKRIEDALDRMNKGYYGVCIESGQPIGRARLDAKPWAKYTIEIVRDREKRGLPT